MAVSRRTLLKALSGSTFFLSAGGALAVPEWPEDAATVAFMQGVASGDPQPDAIMLWTRAQPTAGPVNTVPLLLQLSRDAQFTDLVLQSALQTGPDSDYTVRAYVDGLDADSHYYYRFLGAGGALSRTGRTRTAPAAGQVAAARLAFVSCQNYEEAYYGSWARLLQDDAALAEDERIQFVLHLGDFIYERSWFQRSIGGDMSRQLPPLPDGVEDKEYRYAVSLADYRVLYQTYINDPYLQEARARWPFICTWDDHEFSDNCFQSYVTYADQPVLDATRRQDASQAWFEYIPAILDELKHQPAHDFEHHELNGDEQADNQAALDSLRIYRKLSWGRDLDIVLTDTRSYRSPPCVPEGFAAKLGMPMNSVQLVEIADAGREYNNGAPPAKLPTKDGTIDNPFRHREPGSLLGTEQRDWLLNTLAQSGARWKLWANALPLIPLRLDMSTLPFTDYQDSIFSIDAWAGYPYEVNYLMHGLRDKQVGGVVSLSGDHHMHGAGTVSWSATELDAPPVAVDFNIAGISSAPLFEELLPVARRDHKSFEPLVYAEENGTITPVWNMSLLDGVFAAFTYSKTGLQTLARWLGPNHANPGLRYVDTTANGYGLAHFDGQNLQVSMITMEDCRVPFTEAPKIKHTASFTLAHWGGGEEPQLRGPDFDGGAPFPFESPTV